jgi:hypothetical protein
MPLRRTVIPSMIILLCSIMVAAQDKVSKIIDQPTAPLKILSYQANYQERSSYRSEGIRHVLEYQNVSDRKIVAVQIGLVPFDIWNEFLDKTGGVSMQTIAPQAKEKGEWLANAYADFSFHTGVAYVSKVRFEDGDIWTADLSAIANEMRKIEKDFDASRLKKKDEGKP